MGPTADLAEVGEASQEPCTRPRSRGLQGEGRGVSFVRPREGVWCPVARNVRVNRRAEGTSELNRRLGAVGKGAVALEHYGVAGDYAFCGG